MTITKRALNDNFLQELIDGKLSTIVDVVRETPELMMCLRGGEDT